MTNREIESLLDRAVCGYKFCGNWKCPLRDGLGCGQYTMSFEAKKKRVEEKMRNDKDFYNYIVKKGLSKYLRRGIKVV